MALEFIKLVKGSSVISQVGNFGFFKLSADNGGSGGDLTFSRTFSENTPAQISAVSAVISANNMTSAQVAEIFGWNIGDTITFKTIENYTRQMRIIGFNHDDKADGSGKAGITLDMVGISSETQMRTSAINSGGYGNSIPRTQKLPAMKLSFPQEWQDVVVPVYKKYANGGGTNFSAVVSTSEELFLLSAVEVFGAGAQGQAHQQEGTQYEYYVSGSKKKGADWWLRTCWDNTLGFMYFYNGSNQLTWQRSERNAFISFAFCV